MKAASVLLLPILVGPLSADITTEELEWRPACDGAWIEVVRVDGRIASVQAQASHSLELVEWSIHYLAGSPSTAEYRRYRRGRIQEGDSAGEYSGNNPLIEIQTHSWSTPAKVPLTDSLKRQLDDLLNRVDPPPAP